jgi:DNA-binding NarL/FixJ family response regulator
VQDGFGLPESPWDLVSHRILCTGGVSDRAQAQAVALAAVRGAALAVAVADDWLLECLVEDLSRVGAVAVRDPHAAHPIALLDPGQCRLLELVAAGATLAAAADQLGWSRRTINRRLARIRETLGVATTAEALVLARSARSA